MASPINSPQRSGISNYYNTDIEIRKNVSTLIEKEPSFNSLGFTLPSIIKQNSVGNIQVSNSPSKLTGAAKNGNFEQVKSLIDKGVNINMIDESGATSIHLACQANCSPTFRKGSSLYTANRSRGGHLDVIKYLKENGADVNKLDNNGFSPLYVASRSGHLEIVQYLTENGADVNISTHAGWTPLNIAADRGYLEIVTYLIECGAEINSQNNKGATPLFNACKNGHYEIVRILIENGADVNIDDCIGRMPLFIANSNNHSKIVNLLVNATPMNTLRMPTSFKASFDEIYSSAVTNKSFTSGRLTRVKRAELSDESSDDDDFNSPIEEVPPIQKQKNKTKPKVQHSRSWIQFRELS